VIRPNRSTNADGTAIRKPITHVTFLLNFFDELKRMLP